MLTGIKKTVHEILFPSPIQKQSHLKLRISWLVLASICLILGIVLGITVDWMKSIHVFLNFYFVLSLCSIIPFLHIVIKLTVRTIARAVSMGKKVKHTKTEVERLSNDSLSLTTTNDGINVYEIKKVEKNEGGLFGVIAAIISIFFYYFLFVFAGAIILITRYIYTTIEIVKYTKITKATQVDAP